MKDTPTLPEGLRFGVATCGFQVEGGQNGPGEPANNWFDGEADGRVDHGDEAALAYRRIIEGLRSGDRSVLGR